MLIQSKLLGNFDLSICLRSGRLLWFTLMLGCAGDTLEEYPPSAYLTIGEQQDIIFSFARASRDHITKKDAELVFKLRYFVEKNHNSYYLFSEHHNMFFTGSFICHGGKMSIDEGDTTFTNIFTGEVPSEVSVDSLKFLFNHMIHE